MSSAKPVAWRQLASDPVLFLAFGFGSGLSPKAPGTAGTVVAVPLVMAAVLAGKIGFVVITLLLCVIGVWLCGEAARRIDVHDHPGIVWDEFAGLFVTFLWFPPGPAELLLGFVLFRLFDIWKPWPIREMDHSIPGGLGIMLDDVIAGVFAALALAVARSTIL
ncbi:MAG: phosphatidylglycerophosphatase A [Gammaproteobacteria bacterium]